MQLLTLGALVVSAAGAALASGPDYLPLEQGNRWVYKAQGFSEMLTISVGTPVAMRGNVYYRVRGYAAATLLIRRADNGDLYWYDEDRDIDVLLTSFEPQDRGWYDTFIDGCEQGAQARKDLAEVPSPVGTFKSVREVQYRSYSCWDRGLAGEAYVDNLGLLKRTVSTIAGPRTFELVYARVGALRITSEPGTYFRLGIASPAIMRKEASETPVMRTSLRLSVDRSHAVPLRYTTSQRFELQLRNESGEVVYAWADDVSLPVVKDDHSYELEHSLDLPLRHRSGEALPDGMYTLTGWLTAEGKPFSAAATFQLLTN